MGRKRSSRPPWSLVGLIGVGLLVMAPEARAIDRPGGYEKDEAWGFKIRVPQQWIAAPMSAQERWIATKYVAPQPLYGKKTEYNWAETPELWVIGFPHDRERTAKREKKKDGKTEITIDNPYKDYKDFLKREKWAATSGGGFYFAREEESEHAGMKVSIYEIKVEKLVHSPLRIVTHVYHLEEADFAVQFKILEDYYDDWKKTITTCLESFRPIERTKPLTEAITGTKVMDAAEEEGLSAEEKRLRRSEGAERLIAQEIARLPDDWYHLRTDHYVALSCVDKEWTKETLQHAEACRAYLDETFPGVGNDYVPVGIIRIFANRAQESAFNEGTASLWADRNAQILVSKEHGAEADWQYQWMAKAITRQWIEFKNKNLSALMPFWIRVGLENHMGFARLKGRRLVFQPDSWDCEQLRTLIRSGKALPLRELVQASFDDFQDYGHTLQSGSVVGYLLGSKGNRGKCKNAICTYVATLVTVIEEEERKMEEKRKQLTEDAKKVVAEAGEGSDSDEDSDTGEESDADEEGLSDEEAEKLSETFDEMWEDFMKALEAQRKTINDKAFSAAFGSLSPRDWEKLDAAWKDDAD